MKARPQRKTEKPQRRTKDEHPQNRADPVRRLPITMRRDANQRKTKRGEPKKPKEGEQPRVVYKVRDRVRSRKRRARAIVRRAHSALPLTRQSHVGDRVSDVVRRVAREFGKEVHNLFLIVA